MKIQINHIEDIDYIYEILQFKTNLLRCKLDNVKTKTENVLTEYEVKSDVLGTLGEWGSIERELVDALNALKGIKDVIDAYAMAHTKQASLTPTAKTPESSTASQLNSLADRLNRVRSSSKEKEKTE